ncbi:Receptor-like protein kinase 1 [Theobroma cacao]|uniref:non-specific serine/threonine protein kinase n=1 Tax=Theobroma cacao TaxID=3641 RepID=A0A061GST8_THECC|nr:Receptor-like protein kinase 1 [Theobroma cacao]
MKEEAEYYVSRILAKPCFVTYCVTAQTYRNITLGSSISARNDNSSWTSPSGDFAFGFQQIGTEMFILAIWFSKIPEKTIIWSANGENLVQEGSKIELTTDGQFVLSDAKGKEVWTATLPVTEVAYAAMLDTGNFVLASQDSTTLWESFNQRTDTILPAQQFNQGNRLVARYSEMNYSSGRFEFILQADGNLVLYTRAFPLDLVNTAYWSSKTVGSGFQVIFNQSGYIYLIARNGSILSLIASNGASTSEFYQRAILEYDGVFRQYIYPKTNGASSGRSMSWSLLSSLPSDICMSITEDTGGGACGFNSYCVLGTDQRPRCECPPGYSFLDPSNQMNGCKQDFVSQDCDGLQEANLFGFRDMPNTDWPLSDYEYFQTVSEDWCRQTCLNDCFCAVAIFRNGNCWKKKIPLSNGRLDPRVGGKALIKIRQENSTCKSVGEGSNNNDPSTLILIGSLLLSSSVFLNFLLLIVTLFVTLRFNSRRRKMLQLCPAMQGMSLRYFTYKELEEASSNFKEELGRGAFSTVYKGVLDLGNKNLVAIKNLEKVVTEGEQEFQAEMNTIGKTNHKNLVQLLGFCNEGQHRLLVYEYMSNGSLADYLFGNSRPNWHKRKQIAFGTARGLVCLHEECSNQIIHCDIKPQNILLDESFTPKNF